MTKLASDDEKLFETCFFCGRRFQMGPNRNDGKWLGHFEISVCRQCYKGNWDGWAPHYEAKLVPHLQSKGIRLPARNEAGFLCRDPIRVVEIIPKKD